LPTSSNSEGTEDEPDSVANLYAVKSLTPGADASPTARADGLRRCRWCHRNLEEVARPEAEYCSHNCRQAAWRLRCRRQTEARDAKPLRMAYADPPYPGLAKRYYGDQPNYAGEVDHEALIASLRTSYDGWALSTSMKALRWILPLCPEEAHVYPWVKPTGAPRRSRGLHNKWEPLIVVPGRELTPGKPDFLLAQPARFGGTLPGRKPPRFVAFLFDALGLLPGDTFDDLFPGTGIVSRTWALFASAKQYSGDTSEQYSGDTSEQYSGDVSQPGRGDVSGDAG